MTPTVAEPVALYVVRKRCYECGAEWDGHSFVPHPDGAEPLPGMCSRCIGKAEARFATTHRGRDGDGPLPELQRPRREPGEDEEGPF